MKLVLDTNVIVAAARSPSGASAELLRMARRQELVICVSVPLFLEYEVVLKRAEHIAASGLSHSQIDVLLTAMALFAEPVETHFHWRPVLRDPDDEMVMETAVNAGAQAIVTFNRRDFLPEMSGFGLDIMLPREILRRLE